MQSPFWQLFYTFKSSSISPISIDQYTNFVEALHKISSKDLIENKEDLKKFCKIFWLPEISEEPIFDNIFDTFFKDQIFEKYIEVDSGKGAIDSSIPETILPNESGEENETLDPNPNSNPAGNSDKIPAGKKDSQDIPPIEGLIESQEPFVDFELIVNDDSAAAFDTEKTEKDFDHNFNLSDQAIMPFNLRHFAQRLRRCVENSYIEYTDRIHLSKMIQHYTEQGFVEEIIYEKRNAGSSNVVFFADRFGSMNAYEHWEKQLEHSFEAIPYCKFEHYYFKNLPEKEENGIDYILENVQPSNKVRTTQTHQWDKNTWFFIFSDAGAHSGVVNKERLKQSREFWRFLRNISTNIYWLNPVPYEFQNKCTAKRLTFTIPMTYPDEQGLNRITNPRKK